jgi:biopolymer transport protein ExbB
LCSLAALAIAVEKLWYLAAISTDIIRFKQELFELVRSNKIQEALVLCDHNPSPIARILKAGILKADSSRQDIKDALEQTSSLELPKLEKRLTALLTIANIAPLLGFLGTVMGLANTFRTIQVRAATLIPVTQSDLAAGIWQALITTVAGLTVAIPTFVVYNYCVSRANGLILEMEKVSVELVDFLEHIAESENARKESPVDEI